jgi:hypothetical protein
MVFPAPSKWANQVASAQDASPTGSGSGTAGTKEAAVSLGPSCKAADYLAGRVPQAEPPPEAARCPTCGWEPEVNLIRFSVVKTREEVRAVDALRREARA